MNKRIKAKLGTFSNDGLGSGIPQLDETTILKMREIINEAEKKLRQVFRIEIKRLDNFIKNEYSLVPNEDSFINWFEKNKLYKNWKSLPKISDEDIFNATQKYLEECKRVVKSIKTKKNRKKVENRNIISENANYSLKILVSLFSDEIFKPNTSIDDIRCVFSNPLINPKNPLYLKINNKAFVYLLEKMENTNIIISSNLFSLIDELGCFVSNRGTILKRNNLDQSKSQLQYKPLAVETEKIIDNIIKNIKIE